ncbi:NADH-quinone oxidoreductase subunit J [Nakamurella lactea]|uniref:NADH-quinone oxidoreductase subunit J n=1 Tax=Nakamurella lactea TaxID=459515 RepID=UPI0004014BC5|nr:DMT family transporter [Nakamurella lactea]
MTGPDQHHPQDGSTPWQRGQDLNQRQGDDADAGDDQPTTVVSRDELATAAAQRADDAESPYPTSQDYRSAASDQADSVPAGGSGTPEPQGQGYPVTRDPEIAEAAQRTDTPPTTDLPPTQWHDSSTDDATRQFGATPGAYDAPKDAPFGAGQDDQPGYRPAPAYSAAPEGQPPGGPMGPGPAGPAGYDPGAQQGPPAAYGSASTGFFSPQAVQSSRVELAPAKSRIGQNLLGALLGLIFVAGAAALYAVVFKSATGTVATGTGHQLALIGIALVLAVPALLSGWAPAAGWFPGIILVIGVGIAIFSDSLQRTYADWSNSIFGTTKAAEILLQWGMLAGFALLLAGIGAHLARRSAEHGVVDRIVNR